MFLLQKASKFYTIFYPQLRFSKLSFCYSSSFLYLKIQHKFSITQLQDSSSLLYLTIHHKFSITQLQDKTVQKIPSKIRRFIPLYIRYFLQNIPQQVYCALLKLYLVPQLNNQTTCPTCELFYFPQYCGDLSIYTSKSISTYKLYYKSNSNFPFPFCHF